MIKAWDFLNSTLETRRPSDIYEDNQEYIDECVECLLKAEQIRSDTELMKEVEPALQAKIEQVKKVLSLKDLRKLASDKALEEQEEAESISSDYFGEEYVLGEKPLKNDQLKIPGKA